MTYHKTLAFYFNDKPLYLDEASQDEPNIRKLVELPWQQINDGEMWGEATKTLTDILFLSARTSICDIWQLLDDYSNLKNYTDSVVLKYQSFIAKHAQTLMQHDGQLIALLQHEGFSQAKEQIEVILKNNLNKKAWLQTVSFEDMLKCDTETNIKSVELISKWKFESTKVIGFGAKKKFAFHLIKMGEIGIIDIMKSCAINQRILIRDLNTLAIFPSEDCRYLAVAFENGEVEIIELTWGGDFLEKQIPFGIFKYKLPQFEAPFMYWNGHNFMYQEEGSGIYKCDLKTGETICLMAPDNNIKSLELRSSVLQDNSVILTMSSEASTQVLLLVNEEAKTFCEIESADIISLCMCGSDKIAVCFSNREVRIFEIKESKKLLTSTILKDMPTCITYDNGSLIIPTVSDDLYVWSFDKSSNPDRIEMPLTSTLSEIVRHIVVAGEGTIFAVSRESVSVLKISHENKNKTYRVLALFPTASDTYAVMKCDKEILLVTSNSLTEIKLSEDKPRVRRFCIDGLDNLLLAWSDGTGIVINCILETRFEVKGIPHMVASVTGDPNGGFWIADGMFGDIYYIHTKGAIQLVFNIGSNTAHVQNLLCTEKNLIWRGWVDDKTETGEEHPDSLIFFEKYNVNQIRLIGKRLFNKAEGFIETIEYDNFKQSVIIIFHLRLNETIGISFGSVEDYISRKEIHKSLDWIDAIGKFANCVCNNNLYLLSNTGSIYCVDSETLKPNAVLTPSIPFRLLSAKTNKNGEVLIADSESKIFSCRYINPE